MIKSRFNDVEESNNTILEVVLDDGDEMIDCIERAFIQNDIKKAGLLSASGKLRDVKVATTKIGSLRQRVYDEPCTIKSVSGEFNKVKDGEYMGDVHIAVARDEIHQVNGVLLKGTAHGEVKIRLKVITDLSIGIIRTPEGEKTINMVKEKILEETAPKPKKPMIIS
ncbi:MAG: DUF296 domain-containing protein [Candidatus ainarchaeum sp.]|jgi:predicted DNA-binding protein with PD1-like motif|nr:DUF296 domain-containing protein [Candidatus ainarchaeum sp.]